MEFHVRRTGHLHLHFSEIRASIATGLVHLTLRATNTWQGVVVISLASSSLLFHGRTVAQVYLLALWDEEYLSD